jgi:hypothetical protein
LRCHGDGFGRVPGGETQAGGGHRRDQFRYDYLSRFRRDYKAGLTLLPDQGAVFADAHYLHDMFHQDNPNMNAGGRSFGLISQSQQGQQPVPGQSK